MHRPIGISHALIFRAPFYSVTLNARRVVHVATCPGQTVRVLLPVRTLTLAVSFVRAFGMWICSMLPLALLGKSRTMRRHGGWSPPLMRLPFFYIVRMFFGWAGDWYPLLENYQVIVYHCKLPWNCTVFIWYLPTGRIARVKGLVGPPYRFVRSFVRLARSFVLSSRSSVSFARSNLFVCPVRAVRSSVSFVRRETVCTAGQAVSFFCTLSH